MKQKNVLTIMLALILTLALTVPVSAAPKFDLVAGSGRLSSQYGSPYVHVNAKSTSETTAQGQFYIQYPETEIRGEVQCLYVSGDTAYVVGLVKESNDARWQVGDYLVIGVLDLGEAADPAYPVDSINFSPGMDTQPACAPNGAASPVLPLVYGDFVVHDATFR